MKKYKIEMVSELGRQDFMCELEHWDALQLCINYKWRWIDDLGNKWDLEITEDFERFLND